MMISSKHTGKKLALLVIFLPVFTLSGAFNATTKDNPLIPMGTPDPYTPPK